MPVKIENSWVMLTSPDTVVVFPLDNLQGAVVQKDGTGAQLFIEHAPSGVTCSVADARELLKRRAGGWASA